MNIQDKALFVKEYFRIGDSDFFQANNVWKKSRCPLFTSLTLFFIFIFSPVPASAVTFETVQDLWVGRNVGIATTAPMALLQIGTEPSPALIVTGAGNVGIGTTTPIARLDIKSSGSQKDQIVLARSDAVTPIFKVREFSGGQGGMYLYNGADFTTLLNAAGDSYLNGGNVGIGTSAPVQKLHVEGQCVTGDTLLRRRRRRKNADGTVTDEWEDARIDQIQAGDEILTLDEDTGLLVTRRVRALMDMGTKPIYKITTASGKSIRTTGNHPYLAAPAQYAADTNFMFDLFVNGLTRTARKFYFDVLEKTEMKVPVFGGEKVNISRVGWQHLALGKRRSRLNLISRMLALPKVATVLLSEDAEPRYHRRGDEEFWVFTAIVDDVKVKVVVRSINGQDKHFYSVIWQGEQREIKEAEKRMSALELDIENGEENKNGAVSRLCPRHRGLVTPQLQLEYTTFAKSLSSIIFNPAFSDGSWIKVCNLKVGDVIAVADAGEKQAEWDKVTKIELLPAERVFDIEVEGTHNFVANGIIAHNTYIQGNTGIGTTAPVYNLQVIGTLDATTITQGGAPITPTFSNISSGTNVTAQMVVGTGANLTAAGTGTINATALQGSTWAVPGVIGATTPSTAAFTTLTTTGNVGIGTTGPGAKLDVNGDIFPSSDAGGSLGANAKRWLDIFGSRLKIADGSVSAPSITFANDLNTGIYRNGNEQMGLVTNGIDRIFINSGNVGIGTTGPGQLLHIYQATGSSTLLIETDANGGGVILLDGTRTSDGVVGSIQTNNAGDSIAMIQFKRDGGDDAGSIAFLTQPAGGSPLDRMWIKPDGNVGIATTIPTGRLEVGTTRLGYPSLFVTAGGSIGIGTTNPGAYSLYVNGDTYLGGITVTGGTLSFGGDLNMKGHQITNASNVGIGGSSPGNAALAVITGNVGIGSTAPAARLTTSGTTEQLRLEYDPSNYQSFTVGSDGRLSIAQDGSAATFTLTNGNVGIGTTGPLGLLQVATTTIATPALIVRGGAGSINVGIGTSAPAYNLQVIGTLDATTITQGGAPITPTFSNISSGTNVTAQMVVGTGANLTYSGDGTIIASNADKLLNATWAAPGAIGSTTPSTAAFTTLTTNGNVGIGTTGPGYNLEISNVSNPMFVVTDTSDNVRAFIQSADVYSIMGTLSAHDLKIRTGDTDRISITHSTGLVTIAQNLVVSGTGNTTIAGNVGIGTTAPITKLNLPASSSILIGTTQATNPAGIDIVNSGGYGLVMSNNETDATTKASSFGVRHYTNAEEPMLMIRGSASSGVNALTFGGGSSLWNSATQLDFYTAANSTTVTGTSRMTIDSAGNVGIGTASPGTPLHIEKAAGGTGVISLLTLDSNSSTNGDGAGITFVTSADSTVIGGQIAVTRSSAGAAYGDMIFSTKGTAGVANEKVRITSSGNVGIGTTAPGGKLDIVGATSDTAGTNPTLVFSVDNPYWKFRQSTTPFSDLVIDRLYAGTNYEVMRIQRNTGNVGIGTTGPLGLLQVATTTIATPALIVRGGAGSINVGIGTSAPAYNLQVIGTLDATTITQGGSPITPAFADLTSGTNVTAQMVVGSGANLGYAGTGTINASNADKLQNATWSAPGAIGSGTANTGAFTTLTASGNVGIGTTNLGYKLTLVDTSSGVKTLPLRLSNLSTSVDSGVGVDFNVSSDITFVNGRISVDRLAGTSGRMRFYTAGTNGTLYERMVINEAGKIAIGVSSPGSAGFAVMNGNVGIGTTAPRAKFEVNGTASDNYLLRVYATQAGWTAQNVYVNNFGTLTTEGLTNSANNLLFGAQGTTDSYSRFGFGFDNGTPFMGFGPGNTTRDVFIRREAGDLAFTFGTSPSERLRITNAGNLGIATTNPLGLLQVATTSLSAPGLLVQAGGNVGIGTTAPAYTMQVVGTLDATTITQGGAPITPTFGNITSGTNTSAQMVVGSGAGLGYAGTGTINATSLLNATWAAPSAIGSGTPSTAAFTTLTTTGNVGIGTTNPGAYSLYVAGDTYLGGITVTNGALNFGGDLNMKGNKITNASNIAIGVSSPGNSALAVMGGNVGIGTTNPAYKLEVAGSIAIQNGSAIYSADYSGTQRPFIGLDGASTNNLLIGRGFSSYINDMDLGNSVIIKSTGNVGIATTAPTGRLEVGTTTLGRPSLFVTSIGNVGVGTTAPVYAMQVVGTLDATTITQGGSPITSAFSGLTSGTNTSAQMVVGTGAGLGYAGTGTIDASSLAGSTWAAPGAIGGTTPGTAAFSTLTTSGNVGFGTTGPNAKLQIVSETNGVLVFNFVPSRGSYNWTMNEWGTVAATAGSSSEWAVFGANLAGDTYQRLTFGVGTGNGYLGMGTGTATRDVFFSRSAANTFRISSDLSAGAAHLLVNGNIGIGTTAPTGRLEVATTTLGYPSLFVTAGGNVGMGTTAPVQKLHVEGQCVTGDTLLPILREVEGQRSKVKGMHKQVEGRSSKPEGESAISFEQPTETPTISFERANEMSESRRNTPAGSRLGASRLARTVIDFVPIVDVQPGDMVLSLNESTGQIEPHRINGLLDMGTKPVFKLTTADGRTIRTTGNHPYLTKDGWKKVVELRVGDEIAAAKSDLFRPDADGFGFNNKEPALNFIGGGMPEEAGRSFHNLIPGHSFNIDNDYPAGFSDIKADNVSEVFIKGEQDQGMFQAIGENFGVACPGQSFIHRGLDLQTRQIPQGFNNGGINALIGKNSEHNLMREDFDRLFAQLHSEFYGRDDVFFGNSGVFFGDFSDRITGANEIQDIGNGNTRAFDAGLAKAHVGVNADLSFKIFGSHGDSLLVYSTIVLTKKAYHTLKTLSSQLVSPVEAAAINPPDVLWVKIASLDYVGNEHVYDIEVEGTHNFIAGHFVETQAGVGAGRDRPLRRNVPVGTPSTFFGGIIAHNTYIQGNTGIGTTAPVYNLQVIGTLDATTVTQGGSPITSAFSGITSGTNVTAQMVVGTGANLGYSGDGTINASSLQGSTWAVPPTIGSTTPGAAAFTTITTSGNIGIGTTNPSRKLEVNGDIWLSAGASREIRLNEAGILTLRSDPTDTNTGGFRFVSGAGYGMMVRAYSRIGIGMDPTASGTTTLEIQSQSANDNLFRINKFNGSSGDVLSVDKNGNVGIGTTNPTSLLHVNGNMTISGTVTAGSVVQTQLFVSGPAYIAYGVGNVGIGTSIPTAKLDVEGAGNVLLNAGNVGIGTTKPSGLLEVATTTPGVPALVVRGGAGSINVGVGTSAPAYTLQVIGTLDATTITQGGSPITSAFSGITSGTNTSAQMVVGSGANLGYAGTGTINATSLLNATWAAPGAIGSGTPSSGAFTTLSSTQGVNLAATSGNVGIGTTLPTARLQVASATAGIPSLFVTEAGNVGIGTTNPGAYSLYVSGDTYIGGITVTGGALTFGGDLNMQGYKIKNVSNIGIGTSLPGDAGLTVMAGNVGIGTTGPLKEMEISASNPALRLNSTKNSTWTVGEDLSNIEFYTSDVSAPAGVQASIALTAENTTGSQYGIVFRNAGDAGQNMEWMRIRHNGNVGIGTTSPLGLFQAGSGPTPGLIVTGQNGNVGVATTAPVYKLQVVGTLDATTITQGGAPISPTFANLTSGTNTSAQMVVGSGANLGYAGSGTVNASSLVGNTWAAPAAIGSGTPSTAVFTTLTANVNVGIGTTAPNNKLTVNGDIGIPSYGGTGSGFGLNAYYSSGWKASVAGYSSLITQGAGSSTSALNIKVSPYVSAGEAITFTDILTIRGSDAGGSVGIATTAPTGRLEVGTTKLGVPGLFVSDGANTGIGTTAPAYRLDIKSSGSQKDQFAVTKSDADTPIFKVRELSGGQGAMYLYNAGDFTTLFNANGDSYFAGGNLGVGTTMPTGRLVVAGATSGRPSLFVNETGNVGIGTTNPGTYSLYVTGDAYIGGVTVTNGALNFGGDLNMQGHKVVNASNIGIGVSSPGNSALIVMGGNVGIGTSNPGDATLAVMGGNTGIGTTGPDSILHVVSPDTTNIFRFERAGVASMYVNVSGAGYPVNIVSTTGTDFAFAPGGAEKVRLKTDGNVGIGTTAPGARLEIGTTNLSKPALFVDAIGGQVGIGTTGPAAKLEITGAASGITTYLNLNPRSASSNVGAAIDFRVSDDQTANRYLARIAGVRSPSADGASDLRFYTDNASAFSEIMRITGGGNVGIGATDPGAKLDVLGAAFIGTAADRLWISPSAGMVNLLGYDGSGYNDINIRAAAGTQLYIKTDGNTGVGTTAPLAPLHIYGQSGDGNAFIMQKSGTDGTVGFAFQKVDGTQVGFLNAVTSTGAFTIAPDLDDAGTLSLSTRTSGTVRPRIFIQNGGNVGIGTTNPGNYKLYVNGDTYIGGVTVTGGTLSFGGDLNMQGYKIKNVANIGIGTSLPGSAALAVMEGNVGIGTTGPGYKLEVSGSSDSTPLITATNNSTISSGSLGSMQFLAPNLPNTGLANIFFALGKAASDYNRAVISYVHVDNGNTSNYMSFGFYGAGNLLNIQASGNVGIGTTAPGARLEVGTTNLSKPALFVDATSGRVGIGTTGPGNLLHVYTNTAAEVDVAKFQNANASGYTGVQIDRASNFRYALLKYSTAGTNDWFAGTAYSGSGNSAYSIGTDIGLSGAKVTITTTGNVGIGTTDPGSYRLNVNGNTYIGGSAVISGALTFGGDLDMGGHKVKNVSNIGIGTSIPGDAALTVAVGNVGIGTSGPQKELEISAGTSPALRLTSTKNSTWTVGENLSNLEFYTADVSAPAGVQASIGLAAENTAGSQYGMVFRNAGDAGQNLEWMRIRHNGNVGIGTTNPGATLDSRSSIIPFQWGSADAAMGQLNYSGGNPTLLAVAGKTLTIGANNSTHMFINTNGNVGIGTTNPGNYKLYVNGDVYIGGVTVTGGTLSFGGNLNMQGHQITNTSNIGIGASSPGSAALAVMGGNVGIGTETPNANLDVRVATGATIRVGSSADVNAGSDFGKLDFGHVSATYGESVNPMARISARRPIADDAGMLVFQTRSNSANQLNENMVIMQSGNVGIGSTNPVAKLDVDGNIRLSGRISQGSLGDLAEMMPLAACVLNQSPVGFVGAGHAVSTQVESSTGFVGAGHARPLRDSTGDRADAGSVRNGEGFVGAGRDRPLRNPTRDVVSLAAPAPGDVVVIDENGGIRLSSEPNCTSVVGIISTNPAQILRDNLTRAAPVTLSGIVPCKVCNENGAIKPGDLLVSSSIPGHAMRAGSDVSAGTVIGKALEKLEEEKETGVIEVVVMLR